MRAKTVKETLKAMLWMYENTLEWTQKSTWRNILGEPVYNLGVDIHSACLYGNLSLVDTDAGINMKTQDALRSLTGHSLVLWNDSSLRSKKDVIDLLKKLIKES